MLSLPMWVLVLLLFACTSDPPSNAAVGVGDAALDDAASSDAELAMDAAEGSGGTMAGSGGMDGTGGKSIFPSLDAGSGGMVENPDGGDIDGGNVDSGIPDGSIDVGSLFDGAIPPDLGGSAECFADGTAATLVAGGVGTCDNPILVDMSAAAPGEVAFVTLPATLIDSDLPGIGKCGEETARDLAVLIQIPDGADMEVTVEASSSGDPLILVLDKPTANCATGTPALCVDDGAQSDCEYIRVYAPGQPGTVLRQLLVSEVSATDTAYTLRLRLQVPGSGS